MENKETIEEVAERLTKDFPHFSVRDNMDNSDIKGWFLEALQKGAKWQSKRMYSEEEVNEIIAETWLSVEDNEGDETFSQAKERILEEFKKTKDGI